MWILGTRKADIEILNSSSRLTRLSSIKKTGDLNHDFNRNDMATTI